MTRGSFLGLNARGDFPPRFCTSAEFQIWCNTLVLLCNMQHSADNGAGAFMPRCVERRRVADLRPSPRNPGRHAEEQIVALPIGTEPPSSPGSSDAA